MAVYEMTFIFKKGDKTTAKELKQYLTDAKAKILKEEDEGIKTFAYPIAKQTHGHYLFFQVEMSTDKVKEVEAKIKLNEGLLRHLIIRK